MECGGLTPLSNKALTSQRTPNHLTVTGSPTGTSSFTVTGCFAAFGSCGTLRRRYQFQITN